MDLTRVRRMIREGQSDEHQKAAQTLLDGVDTVREDLEEYEYYAFTDHQAFTAQDAKQFVDTTTRTLIEALVHSIGLEEVIRKLDAHIDLDELQRIVTQLQEEHRAYSEDALGDLDEHPF